MARITRRDFLKTAGYSLIGATLVCSGLGYAATRTIEMEEPRFTYRMEESMNNKILIAYATRAGSTAEIAAEVGRNLNENGFAVDVSPIKENPKLEGYQAVILGSAIRMGNWLPEAIQYIEANQTRLRSLPAALFTVHMLNTGADEESRANRLAYLDKVRPLVQEAEAVFFQGVMDYSKLSFLDRMIAKMVGAEEADNRDWERIQSWSPTALSRENGRE